jgi:cytochrome c-type biogenesis protein
MNLYLPVILGLLGFLQPCTMGVNWAFVGHVKGFDRKKRIIETLKLILIRAGLYGLLGATAGYLGSYTAVNGKTLAFPFIALSLIFLVSKFKALPVPNIDLVKTSHLSVRQGLMIPSCLLPITIALLLLSALYRSPAQGLAYLSSFGIFLTLPLLIVSGVTPQILRMPSKLVIVAPILASLGLMVIAGLLYSEKVIA